MIVLAIKEINEWFDDVKKKMSDGTIITHQMPSNWKVQSQQNAGNVIYSYPNVALCRQP